MTLVCSQFSVEVILEKIKVRIVLLLLLVSSDPVWLLYVHTLTRPCTKCLLSDHVFQENIHCVCGFGENLNICCLGDIFETV